MYNLLVITHYICRHCHYSLLNHPLMFDMNLNDLCFEAHTKRHAVNTISPIINIHPSIHYPFFILLETDLMRCLCVYVSAWCFYLQIPGEGYVEEQWNQPLKPKTSCYISPFNSYPYNNNLCMHIIKHNVLDF